MSLSDFVVEAARGVLLGLLIGLVVLCILVACDQSLKESKPTVVGATTAARGGFLDKAQADLQAERVRELEAGLAKRMTNLTHLEKELAALKGKMAIEAIELKLKTTAAVAEFEVKTALQALAQAKTALQTPAQAKTALQTPAQVKTATPLATAHDEVARLKTEVEALTDKNRRLERALRHFLDDDESSVSAVSDK
ncbi:uncharacterized protein PFL1_06019 [Pseudozyma flocculosa PF-1]|uniref:Chromosome partition protein Smc n=1 Tax=Pseudozyma flocculosa PF-1 TaxID=1277687 RepID=A0A061H702_9BASI|nr:uncharacterized protein PFL1_06019 [Pseudozyma flocculosa PF-1]EPQ26371.1 hypothetical protein PFL1_06019 [Pseudozyma flocculosa PF-1]